MNHIRVFLICILACCHTILPAQQIKVACIGDSVTYGTGIEERDTYSYPIQLQNMLGEGYEVANFGRPGATLLNKGHRPYIQQPEFKAAMDFAGDVAIIHLGLNDTDPRNWPNYRDEFISDYLALIDSVRSVNPSVRIMIARMSPITPMHRRFISGTRQWHSDIQEAITQVADAASVELIDFHSKLYHRPDLLPDSLHPNAEGAGILAKTVYQALTGNYGGLQMSPLYCDHMVLQREIPLTIRGTADAGKEVKLTLEGPFRTIRTKTKTNDAGKWEIVLDPLKACVGMTLSIESGDRKLVYKNVAAGEVWVCSGQSNMAFMICESSDAGATPDDDDLRFFDMKARWHTNNETWNEDAIASVQKLEYYRPASWETCREDNAQTFSAIGYHFGKMLRDSLKVPVGLICNAVGGSPTEAWIERSTLEEELPAIFNNWLKNDFVQPWVRERAAKNIGFPESGFTRHPYEPCYLFESGIATLDKFPVKGIIWYQGESNAHNMEAHETLFNLLVKSWREYWDNPEMPFHFVQLSSLNRPSWTWFRDSQRKLAEAIPHCRMAVSSDVGDSLDVHPTRKKPVGERLGKIALFNEYGFDLIPSGPLFLKATARKNKVIVEFDWSEGLQTSDGATPRCFEVAEKNGIFRSVEAIVEDDKVILNTKGMTPSYVRYAWQPFTRANLINGAGLPASTFRAIVE